MKTTREVCEWLEAKARLADAWKLENPEVAQYREASRLIAAMGESERAHRACIGAITTSEDDRYVKYAKIGGAREAKVLIVARAALDEITPEFKSPTE